MQSLKDQAKEIKSQFEALCRERKLDTSFFWYRKQKQYKHEGGKYFFECELRSHNMHFSGKEIQQTTKSLVRRLDISEDWTIEDVRNMSGEWLNVRLISKTF